MKIDTEIGPIWIDANTQALTKISFSEIPESKDANEQILNEACTQLTEYFQGKRKIFDLPLALAHGTIFQQAVWRELQKIPYGLANNYQEVACAIQRPKAVRAVGQANKANPLPIIIPCHRVIGKNGSLTGYMGAGERGLTIKKYLLALEQQNQ